MTDIEIYTRPGCGYCVSAKRLLSSRDLDYVEHDTAKDQQRFAEMLQRTKGRTFPQIFIDGQSVGGFDQLMELDKQATLKSSNH